MIFKRNNDIEAMAEEYKRSQIEKDVINSQGLIIDLKQKLWAASEFKKKGDRETEHFMVEQILSTPLFNCRTGELPYQALKSVKPILLNALSLNVDNNKAKIAEKLKYMSNRGRYAELETACDDILIELDHMRKNYI